MLNIKPPDYKFCPFCGNRLIEKNDGEKRRKYCPIDDWYYYPHVKLATIAIVEKQGKYLMVQRARKPYKNKWQFPGGFLKFGEHPREAVVREIKEETGLTIEPVKLIDVIQSMDDPRFPGHIVFFYESELVDNKKEKIIDIEENQDMGWFPLDNLPEIGWTSHKLIVNRLKDLTL